MSHTIEPSMIRNPHDLFIIFYFVILQKYILSLFRTQSLSLPLAFEIFF